MAKTEKEEREPIVNHPKPGTKVDLRQREEYIGTGKHPKLPKGKRFKCHPVQGIYFVEKGYATEAK